MRTFSLFYEQVPEEAVAQNSFMYISKKADVTSRGNGSNDCEHVVNSVSAALNTKDG